ncbi:unnamed protein product [Rhizophagus irregularis]|nr:unnamed protein product [Rhizophagus irregularis]
MKVTKNSEFLYLLGVFLFFTISTCSSLIPNNRVITNDTKDYDLIEGITYNIVHFMSENNLVSSGDHVTVAPSDDNNPYQHWSLQKVEGKNNVYNIINIGSGTNLDNNGKGVYVGVDRGSANPYQHWIFIKIKNYTYNIANVRNVSRSLDGSIDSNGKMVYISISDKNNPYQQWLFEPINYKLTTVIMDYDFDLNYDNNKQNRKKQINLLSGNGKIVNPSNVTIKQMFDVEETKSNSFTLEIRSSESFKIGAHIDMHFEIGASVYEGLQLKAGISGGIEGEIKSTVEERNKGTVTDKVSYHIKQVVIVPPYTSVQVTAIVDKVNIVAPFNAKIQITCEADRLSKSGKVVKMAVVDSNVIKYYFQRENAGSLIIDGDSFYINTNGTLKIDGYGFDSEIRTKNLETFQQKGTPLSPLSPSNKSESTSESSPKNLVLLYQVILTLFQIIMLLQN